jgi:nucleoside-diphosphate-sugar epimerase
MHGTLLLTASDYSEPLNIGSDQLVTINQLVDLVEDIANVRLRRHYLLDAPKGVRGRNSDNSLIRTELGWEPSTKLNAGLRSTYSWIFDQLVQDARCAQTSMA